MSLLTGSADTASGFGVEADLQVVFGAMLYHHAAFRAVRRGLERRRRRPSPREVSWWRLLLDEVVFQARRQGRRAATAVRRAGRRRPAGSDEA